MLTGVACELVTQGIAHEHYAATGLALLLIGVVLYTGIDSTRAPWRELKPSAAKPEGRAF